LFYCVPIINLYSRYIWSGDDYLTVRGRGACTSFPDMQPVICKTQPKLSNVEYCPKACPNGCENGFCDCATGECLCNPGFSGLNCSTDTCAAAGCVNGNCVSRYLGGDLLVTKNPCVCKEGWYGSKCDSNVKPADPDIELLCLNGSYYYIDTDIEGGNIVVNFNAPKPKDCSDICNLNPSCNAWVSSDSICYLKSGTNRIDSNDIVSGIKCTALSNSSITTSSNDNTTNCVDKCQGTYPYGCNSGFTYGYCNSGGGCSYSTNLQNNSDWCCFKVGGLKKIYIISHNVKV